MDNLNPANKNLKKINLKASRIQLKNRSIDDVNRGFEEEKTETRAKNLGFEYTNLYGFPIDPEVLALVNKSACIDAETVSFFEAAKEVRLASTDPRNPKAQKIAKELEEKNYKVIPYMVSKSSISDAMKIYNTIREVKERRELNKVEVKTSDITDFQSKIKSIQELGEKIMTLPATEVIDILVAGALSTNASDIHVEPEENQLRLRYRIDGVLQDVADLPKKIQETLISRIKILSKLKLNVTTIPQDGRFSISTEDRKIDVRVSILPSAYGEIIVMRLLGIGAVELKVAELGLKGKSAEIVRKAINKPHGMVLTTGPTGSGKTTTLYAFLNEINNPEVKIITIENPVEYRLPGISQTQIDKSKNYDFATALRAILRQDPDVIMVGEIRDLETADTAMNAALTGHLVFSTLHTNDASGVIPRLIDMGVRPFVIAPAINCVIAQRLVRTLCKDCMEEYVPDETEKKAIEEKFNVPGTVLTLPPFEKLFKAKGCTKCNNTGYKGRMGIYEVFEITPEIERLTMSAATTNEIFETAVKSGMSTLAQDGISKMIEGLTTWNEINRVA